MNDEELERHLEALDRRPVRLPVSMRAAVMARVRREPQPLRRRLWNWLATPRMIPLSPLSGAVAAAAVAAVLLFRGGAPQTAAPEAATVATRFVYLAPEASRVAVTGDFAGWNPEGVPLRRTDNGVWVAEIELPPGLHHYVFVVDGTTWQPDPNVASRVDDGFGGQNSVLLIPAPREI